MPVAVQARRMNQSFIDRLFEGAPRFTLVGTITESTVTDPAGEFPEASLHIFPLHVPEPELPDARGIDEGTVLR